MESKFVEMSFPWSVGVLFSLEWLWEAKKATFPLIFLFYFIFLQLFWRTIFSDM